MNFFRPKILIVEDEPSLRESISLYLQEKNMDVLEAESVQDAFRMVEREAPHAVLLDIYLGKELGLDLAIRIAESEILFRKPKILLMSGTVGGELLKTQQFRLDNQVDGFIKKPFALDELEFELVTILKLAP